MLSLFRYFVVAGLINTALFVVLLLLNKRNNTATILLICLMLLVSFQALLNGFDNRDFFLAHPNLFRVSWLQLSLFGPLIYLLVKVLTSESQRLKWVDALHVIPFIIYCVILAPWFLKPASEKRRILEDFEGLSRHDFGWLNQVSLVMIFIYLLFSLRQQSIYRKRIENTFSDISMRRLDWIRQFLYSLLIILVISGLGFYGRKWNIPLITHFYHYNYVIIVGLVYWLAYKCLIQPELFSVNEGPEKTGKEKYRKSGLPVEGEQSIYEKLLFEMDTMKPYLDPALTIYTLAEKLQVSRHHLSQVINERSGKSFYDFINIYRVEEVKRRLKSPAFSHHTILSIAFDAGFNSKATFNATFRKFTGMTPSAYQKSSEKQV